MDPSAAGTRWREGRRREDGTNEGDERDNETRPEDAAGRSGAEEIGERMRQETPSAARAQQEEGDERNGREDESRAGENTCTTLRPKLRRSGQDK